MEEWSNVRTLRKVNGRMPKGGVLSPLLWILVVNDPLKEFEGRRSRVIAYAGDVAFVVKEKFLDTFTS